MGKLKPKSLRYTKFLSSDLFATFMAFRVGGYKSRRVQQTYANRRMQTRVVFIKGTTRAKLIVAHNRYRLVVRQSKRVVFDSRAVPSVTALNAYVHDFLLPGGNLCARNKLPKPKLFVGK